MLHESTVLLIGVLIGFVNKEQLIKLNVSLLSVCSVKCWKKLITVKTWINCGSFLCFHNYPLGGPTWKVRSLYSALSPAHIYGPALLLGRPVHSSTVSTLYKAFRGQSEWTCWSFNKIEHDLNLDVLSESPMLKQRCHWSTWPLVICLG